MAYGPQPQRLPQTMPEDGGGWHHVDAGPHLHVMFHPNRQLLGREPDGVIRKSIIVAVAGKSEQALRFDPFSVGSHYHIRPSLRGRHIALWVEEGQKPLEIALAFFEKPLRLRGLLSQAEEDEVAARLDDSDLASAARQIRKLNAAAWPACPGFLQDPIPRAVQLQPTVEKPAGWRAEERLWQRTVALARRLGYGEEALRAELLRRRDLDQAARGAFAGAPEDKAHIIVMDDANTAWLRTILDRVGWPGRTLVGSDAAHAAWLIAQHADRHPAFQRRCLKLLERAVACGEAATADLAHLTDRVLLARGEPQLYGTQVSARAEGFVAARLCDPETVDARRAAMGLPPLADHPARAHERFGAPHPARVTCPGCGKNLEVRLPEPGGSTRVSCPACGIAGAIETRLRTAVARRLGGVRNRV
jgi:hypothetical protein